VKKIFILVLMLFAGSSVWADKTFNYRGIFPADRGKDAVITNYILLKKGTEVEFTLSEQGKGPTELVKITAVELTSNAPTAFYPKDEPLKKILINETGIYQVKLVPTQESGAEVRFVLGVTERELPAGETPVVAPAQAINPDAVPTVDSASDPVAAQASVPNPATAPALMQAPADLANATIASTVQIQMPATVDLPQNQIQSSETINISDSQTASASIDQALPVTTPSQDSSPAVLIAPAEGFFINPLNGFVFSCAADQPADYVEKHFEVFLLGFDGEPMTVPGQFFSARAGQVTFLPDQLLPGAVYSIRGPDGSMARRGAFPDLVAEMVDSSSSIVFRLYWKQQPQLQANPLGQMIRLDNVIITLKSDENELVKLEPALVAPYGIAGSVNYKFQPYEMVFTLARPENMPTWQIVAEARLDGQADPVVVFKQEFKTASASATEPVAVDEIDPDAVANLTALADLPEKAVFSLKRSFSAVDKEAEIERAWPEELCWSESGSLWLIDTQRRRIMNFNEDGRLLLAFGSKGDQPGEMGLPVAIACHHGRIFVSDTARHCLHKFAEDGSFLLETKGDPEKSVMIDVPAGLDFRGEELWLVDRGIGQVTCLDVEGRYLGGFGDGLFEAPVSLRTDRDGLLVLEKSGILKKFSPMGQQTAGFQTGCVEPRGFDVDPWGTIWVCDASKFQVVRFNQKGRQLAVLKAPPGPKPWIPTGVAVRQDGTVAITDAENKKIHIFMVDN